MAQKTKSEAVVTVVSEAISVRRRIRQTAPPVSRSTWSHYPVDWLVNTHPRKEAIQMGVRLIAEGKLHVPVAATYPLVAAKEAIAHAQRGGKVLFKLT